MKRYAILLGVAVFALAGQAQVKAKHYPGDAKWMLNVDLKALNASPMGRFIQQMVDENGRRGLASFQSLTGINLTNDVDSVVIYGRETVQSGGVTVVYGRFDVAKLTAIAGGAKEFQNKAFGERSVLSWNENKRRKSLCFVDPTIAVIAQDEAAVRDAVARMDGQAPGMGENGPFARTLTPSKGRFVALQANDVAALAGANPQIQMFKQADAALLEVSQLEAANGLDFALAIKAQNPEMAQQFSQAAQGLQALLQLQAAQNPDMAALAQGVKVALQGEVVSVNLAVPEEQIRKMVQVRIEQQKAAAEARRAARQAKQAAEAGAGEGGEKPERPAF